MPTVITVEQSPTNSSVRSDSFTDEGSSTGTGVLVSPTVGSQESSDLLDETWDPVYSDEIEPSESASRPRPSQQYRSASRPASVRRGPTRRHTTSERASRRPAITRVHRHPAQVAAPTVDFDDYTGYGRGYPAQQQPPYGRPHPHAYPQSYVSTYSPNPYSGSAGQVVPFGAPGYNGYPHNPFSPAPGIGQPAYFAGHHPISPQGTPGYGGHDMMAFSPGPQFGYPPSYAIPPPNNSGYFQQYLVSEPQPVSNPEVDKKIASLEKLVAETKLESDKKAAAEKKAAEDAATTAATNKKIADEVAIMKAKVEAEAKEKADAEKKAKDEADAKAKKESDAKAAAAAAAAPTPKKPIKFKDAVGRKFSFPFHLCQKWAGMEDLIRQAFMHVEGIGAHVAEGHYDLIGPNGEIILPQVWETMIEPDWSITMHLWPMPEPPKPPENVEIIDAHPGLRAHGKSRSGVRADRRRSTLPAGLGDPARRNRGPPPPPPGWVGPPPGATLPSGIILMNDEVPSKKKKEKSSGGIFGFGSKKSSGKGKSRR